MVSRFANLENDEVLANAIESEIKRTSEEIGQVKLRLETVGEELELF